MIKRELAFRKKWVEWVIAFTQIDVDSMAEPMKKRFMEEAAFFASPYVGTFDESTFRRRVEEGKTDILMIKIDLKKIQQALTPIVRWLISNAQIKNVANGLFIDHKLEGILSILALDKDQTGIDRIVIAHTPNYQSANSPLEKNAELNFSELLTGLPIHSVKKCEGCGKYFLHVTQRQRRFCSPRCYSRCFFNQKMEKLRKNTRKHESFKKKRADYMRKRYKAIKLGEWPMIREGRS